MSLEITINGLDQTRRYLMGTLDVDKRWGVETMRLTLQDRDRIATNSYRPALGARIRVVHDRSALLFGGIITRVEESVGLPPDAGALLTSLEARGLDLYATEVHVTEFFPAGKTLGQVASLIFKKYLEPKGLQWRTTPELIDHPPILPELKWERTRCDRVLTDLTETTGWPWRIQGDGIGFYQDPNSIQPGVNSPLSRTNARVVNELRWTREHVGQINRVILQIGTRTTPEEETPPEEPEEEGEAPQEPEEPEEPPAEETREIREDNYGAVGDGAKQVFLLLAQPAETPTVIANGVEQPVDGTLWTYDPTLPAVRRAGPLFPGHTLVVRYPVESGTWLYVVAPEALRHDGDLRREVLRELVITRTDLTTIPAGLAAALAMLQRRQIPEQVVRVATYTAHWFPIIAAELQFPERQLMGTYIIQATTIRDVGMDVDQEETLLYELECTTGTLARRDWTEFWRDTLGGAA